MTQQHTVSVLFSKQCDHISQGLYFIMGRRHTHVSIRLDEMGDCFYSFNVRGFCIEKLQRFNLARTECSTLYQFAVTTAVYVRIQRFIEYFLAQRERYCYDGVGLARCILHLPRQASGKYFCSQFVSKLLMESGALSLRRAPAAYLPSTLEKELCEYDSMQMVVRDPFKNYQVVPGSVPVKAPGMFRSLVSLIGHAIRRK